MRTASTRAALLRALITATSVAALSVPAAHAQLLLGNKERQAPDENGVDVISGKMNAPVVSITAGRPGEGGLTYASGWAGGEYYDAFTVQFTLSGSNINMVLFGNLKRFTPNASIANRWESTDGDGSFFTFDSATNIYKYTGRDGTEMVFSKALGNTIPTVTARVSTITKPDGEILTYSWLRNNGRFQCDPQLNCVQVLGAGRVQGITSNLGYTLKATYASNTWNTNGTPNDDWSRLIKVTAINNTVDSCDPAANACASLTQSWPELTLGTTTSGGIQTSTIIDRLSNTTTITSGASGVISVQRPGVSNPDFSVSYDGNGRVMTLSRGGGSWGYTYSDSGSQRTTVVTQPLGGSKTYVSDLNIKRVLSFTNELGRTTSYTYDAAGLGRVERVTMPEGNYTQLTYDGRGNVTQTVQVAKSGSGLANLTSSASYDASCSNPKTCNQPNSTTDIRGGVTDYTYDATHGGLLTATAPAPTSGAPRPQVRNSYTALTAYYKNTAGTLTAAPSAVYRQTSSSTCQTGSTCAGTADEVLTTVTYGTPGVANNLLATSVSQGAGNGSLTATSAVTYDVFGNVETMDGPLPGSADTTRYRYDAEQQLVGVISPDPDGAGALPNRAVRYVYSADGQTSSVQLGTVSGQTDAAWAAFSPSQSTSTTFDVYGRPTQEDVHGGPARRAVTQYSYDIAGRLDCTAIRMNAANLASIPASACTPATVTADGPDRITKNNYDYAGQVTSVQSGYGTTGVATDVAATYTNNGQVETVTDGESNRTTYQYDGFDRLVKTRYPVATKGAATSSTTDYEELVYNAQGDLTQRRLRGYAADSTQVVQFGYDGLARLVSEDAPGSDADQGYSYDLLGRLTQATRSGGFNTSFTYDALGRRTQDAQPYGTMNYQYDLAGRRTRATWPDSFYVTYDYSATGEVNAIRENGGTALVTYTYDSLGRRNTLSRGNGTSTTYGYDNISRLTSLTLAGSSANVTLGYIYNAANQITSTTRSNDAYAWNGATNVNRGHVSNGLNQYNSAGSTAFTYDARGNLATSGGSSYSYWPDNLMKTAPGGVSFNYDALGRLAQYGVSGATRMYYDGVQLAAETNGSGTLQKRYIFGPGADEALVEYDSGGNKTWLAADERGSVIARTNGNGSASVNNYDEFGIPGAGNTGRFQYTGQAWMNEVGFYNYKARAYSASLGRFLQPDTLGYRDGLNWYAYVQNDPISNIDPTGTQCISLPGDGIGGCTETDPIVVTGHPFSFDIGGVGLSGSAQRGRRSPKTGYSWQVLPSGQTKLANGKTITQCALEGFQGFKEGGIEGAIVGGATGGLTGAILGGPGGAVGGVLLGGGIAGTVGAAWGGIKGYAKCAGYWKT